MCVRRIIIDIHPVGPRQQQERAYPVRRGVDEPRQPTGAHVFVELNVGQVEAFFFFHVVVHQFVCRKELVANRLVLLGVPRSSKSESCKTDVTYVYYV